MPGGENVLMVLARSGVRGMAVVLPLFRCAAVTVAAGRAALGVSALVRPSALARPWVGPAVDEPGVRVLARALGARDLALGLGALAAAGTAPAGARRRAGAWFAAGALSDALDAAVTAAAWQRLPRRTRWLVAAAAGGAAAAGASGTLAAFQE